MFKRPGICLESISLRSLAALLALIWIVGCGDDAGFVDEDGDGAGANIDCDDMNASIGPGAAEVPYDGIDQDCDGADLIDSDGDGSDADAAGGDDCDDTSPDIYPGATETPYDAVDQDCDGSDLDDVDGDGYIASEVGGDDCDDQHADSFPAGVEVCGDGIDQDCSGADQICNDLDEDLDGYTTSEGDCDDEDADVNPGADEIPYNGQDDDCSADTPDDDVDMDGFTRGGGGDCDDMDASSHPGGLEIPYDGVDQDCSGTDLTDVDRDGYEATTVGGPDCNDMRSDINPDIVEIPYDDVDQDCDGADVIGADVVLTSASGSQHSPALAAGSARYFVTWIDNRSGGPTEIFGRLTDFAGDPIGSEVLVEGAASGDISNLSVAFGAGHYLVSWQEGSGATSEVLGRLVDVDGRVLARGVISSSAQTDQGPDVAFVDDDFLVAWYNLVPTGRWTSERRLMTRVVHADGTMESPVTAEGPSAGEAFDQAALCAGTTSALVAWRSTGGFSRAISALGLDGVGVATGPYSVLTTNTGAQFPKISFDGTNFLVVTQRSNNVYGFIVDTAGAPVGTEFVVSDATAIQSSPSSAFVSGEHVVVFTDTRLSVRALFAQRVAPDGTLATPSVANELLIAEMTAGSDPAIASAGTSALVVWSRGGDIEGSVFAP